jgi:hypothetical protein
MKRPFTAVDAQETIALKRARRYLTTEEETEAIASPFFSRRAQDRVQENVSQTTEETTQPEVEEIEREESIKATDEMEEVADEPQVSESPPRVAPTEVTEMDDEEIISDSPTCPLRTGILPTQLNDFNHTEAIEESPEYQLPPSPLLSRSGPPIFSLANTRTPILHPGMKKAYTPRPSHVVFPDTPTPSPTQNLLIQNWKQRFLNTNSTPRLSNTISTRPMTPLHTPFFKPRTNPTFSSEVDQIEDSPPRGKTCLDRFRYIPH